MPDTGNVPIQWLQSGSTFQVTPSGTILVASGGSIQVASGASIAIASGGSLVVASGAAFSAPGGLVNGGTLGRWAFGTVGLTSGVGTVATGLNRVVSANVQPISADAPGLGSFTTAVVDLSLSAAGSIIIRAGAGTLPYTNNGTAAWLAFGT